MEVDTGAAIAIINRATCSFLGLVIYGKFQSQVANSLAPLYKKLQKASQWKWDFDEQKAFDVANEKLTAPCCWCILTKIGSLN